MSRVFISYRRSGAAGFAHGLRRSLRSAPLALPKDDVFLDETSIEFGEQFPERIRQAISVAKVFLLLVEPQWLDEKREDGTRKIDCEDDFCRQELLQALERLNAGEDITVIPVVCGGAPFPDQGKIPECLRSIKVLNRASLGGRHFDQQTEAILTRISKLLRLPSVPLAQTAFEPEKLHSQSHRELLQQQTNQLDQQLSEMADELGHDIAQNLLISIRKDDRAGIIDLRDRLNEWFERRGGNASSAMKCKAYTLLAEAAFSIEAADRESDNTFDTSEVRRLVANATKEYDPSVTGDDADRLLCLNARVEFIDEKHDAALAMLDRNISPICLRFRIAMLQEVGRLDDAVKLLDSVPRNERWANVGITLLAAAGRMPDAEELCNWAVQNGDAITAAHCRVALAWSQYSAALSRFSPTDRIMPEAIFPEERERLQKVNATLKDVIDAAVLRGCPEHGIEIKGLELAFRTAHLQKDQVFAERTANVLMAAVPASIQAGYAMLWDCIPFSPEFALRLRTDRPNSFEANYLSFACEFAVSDDVESLVPRISGVWALAKDAEDKDRFATLLVHLIPMVSPESRDAVKNDLVTRLGDQHKSVRLLSARSKLSSGDIDGAVAIAGATDPVEPEWLVLWAEISEKQEKHPEALSYLQRASSIIPHPHLLWRTAVAASRTENWALTVELLQKVVQLEPGNTKARRQLVMACLRVADRDALLLAVQQLKVLQIQEPDLPEHILNRAVILARLSEHVPAIIATDELLTKFDGIEGSDRRMILPALLLRAQVLAAQGRSTEAFESLTVPEIRQQYWSEIPFLHHYMQLAFESKQERAGHDALQQIVELEKGLPDERKSARPASVDMIKQLVSLHSQVLQQLRLWVAEGKCPVAYIADEENRPLILESVYRTQALIVPEDKENHGAFVTYASNGLILRPVDEQLYVVTELTCPARGSAVVIDQTAIVTLQRLNLLDTALSFFSSVRVSGRVLSEFLEDVRRLRPHQRSMHDAVTEVARLLGQTKLDKVDSLPRIVICEHEQLPDRVCFGVANINDWLCATGNLSESEQTGLNGLNFSRVDGDIDFGWIANVEQIGVTARSMITLAKYGLLERVVGLVRLCVTQSAELEIRRHVDVWQHREELRIQYERIVEQLRGCQHVRAEDFQILPDDPVEREDEIREQIDEALRSVKLASKYGEHLLADDRVCQQAFARETASNEHSAFSTWQLVEALFDERLIGMPQLGKAILQMIDWRYQFFVPRSDVLVHFAKEFRSSCPGQPLKKIASYMMECMADPGLHCSFEPTYPQTTISAQLFLQWTDVVVDFIFGIWMSRDFSEPQKLRFIEWVLSDCLPTPAVHASRNEQLNLANGLAFLSLSKMLIKLSVFPQEVNSAKMMTTMYEALGLSRNEYCKIVAQVAQTCLK